MLFVFILLIESEVMFNRSTDLIHNTCNKPGVGAHAFSFSTQRQKEADN